MGGVITPLEPQSRFGDKLLEVRVVCPQRGLEPQSRFGDRPVKFRVVCPQNGTAVLKGLMNEASSFAIDRPCVSLGVSYPYAGDTCPKQKSRQLHKYLARFSQTLHIHTAAVHGCMRKPPRPRVVGGLFAVCAPTCDGVVVCSCCVPGGENLGWSKAFILVPVYV